MAFLQALNGGDAGRLYRLDGARAVLGRHPDCDIVLDEGAVSRQHAQLSIVEDGVYVEDMGSRNGTFVNGEQVRGRFKLHDDDRVKICDLLFSFHLNEPGRPGLRPIMSDGAGVSLTDDPGAAGASTIMST